jgi:hypothetical protein
MELGAIDAEDAIQLPRAEVPLELQKSFTGLRNVPLFYAQYCRKLSHRDKVQNRVMIATLDHLYCCHPNGDILRCFPHSYVEKIIHDPERKQVALIIPNEYDLLITMLDTFHFVHVVHSLRALHASETPLVIEMVKRSRGRTTQQSQSLKNGSSYIQTTEGGVSSSPPQPGASSTQPRSADDAGAAAGKPVQSFLEKILSKMFSRPPPGVIIGWNDAFYDLEDDGSGENVVGSESEVCLGKGHYALRLAKPEGFQLSLYNVSSEGI